MLSFVGQYYARKKLQSVKKAKGIKEEYDGVVPIPVAERS